MINAEICLENKENGQIFYDHYIYVLQTRLHFNKTS